MKAYVCLCKYMLLVYGCGTTVACAGCGVQTWPKQVTSGMIRAVLELPKFGLV